MDVVSSRSRLSKAFIELFLKKKIPATRWTGLERPNLSGNKFVQYIYCAFQEHANSEVQKATDRTNHADRNNNRRNSVCVKRPLSMK